MNERAKKNLYSDQNVGIVCPQRGSDEVAGGLRQCQPVCGKEAKRAAVLRLMQWLVEGGGAQPTATAL